MITCTLSGLIAFIVFFQVAKFEGLIWMSGLLFIFVMAGGVLAELLNRGAKELAKLENAL